jgi:regulator of Ty1 transposition protein 103
VSCFAALASQTAAAPRERLMPLLYLANDIMQNSRKKGAEFCMAFSKVIPAAIQHVYT